MVEVAPHIVVAGNFLGGTAYSGILTLMVTVVIAAVQVSAILAFQRSVLITNVTAASNVLECPNVDLPI